MIFNKYKNNRNIINVKRDHITYSHTYNYELNKYTRIYRKQIYFYVLNNKKKNFIKSLSSIGFLVCVCHVYKIIRNSFNLIHTFLENAE